MTQGIGRISRRGFVSAGATLPGGFGLNTAVSAPGAAAAAAAAAGIAATPAPTGTAGGGTGAAESGPALWIEGYDVAAGTE